MSDQLLNIADIGDGSGISEAASEIQIMPKRKRGRPPVFAAGDIATYQMIGATVCRRTAVDGLFTGIGLRVLGADDRAQLPDRFSWLNGKRSVLAQIGRLSHEANGATAREVAALLCVEKPRAKAAVAWLRQIRPGLAGRRVAKAMATA